MRNMTSPPHPVYVSPRVLRAGLTALSHGGLAITRAGVSFLTVSMLLRYLGQDSFGLAITITGMASWLSLSQGGISQTVRNHIISGAQTAGAAFSDAFATLFCIVIGLGLLLTAAAFLIPWPLVLNSPGFHQRPLILTSVWIMLFSALFGLVRPVYSALQREYQLAPALALGIAASFGLVMWGVNHQWSPTLVVSLSLVAPLIGSAAGLFLMPFTLGIRLIRPSRVFRGGFWFFMIEACTILIFQADIFLINLFLGAAQAAVFALHAQLFAFVQMALYYIVAPYWPAFGEAWHCGERQWLRVTARRLGFTTAALSIAGAMLLLATGRPLMDRWSHGTVAWNPTLALMLGTGVVVQSVTGVFATALGALGIARGPARVIIVQSVLNVGVCIWLMRRFGIVGVAAGSLITYTVTSGAWLPVKFRQVTS